MSERLHVLTFDRASKIESRLRHGTLVQRHIVKERAFAIAKALSPREASWEFVHKPLYPWVHRIYQGKGSLAEHLRNEALNDDLEASVHVN